MERKSIVLEVKDLSRDKRTAIIAHAAYDNLDQTNDVSRKGMFTKSWQLSKNDISFYLNHDDTQAPGKVEDVYEDKEFAYTKVWLGTHSLGNDTLIMMDEGVIKKASFGYITTKSRKIDFEGRKNVRELNEVRHLETSVLTKMPANLKAGVMSVTKAFETLSDVELKEFYGHLSALEKFCRNTRAPDECIKHILSEVSEVKEFIQEYNARFTRPGQPLDQNAWKGWFDKN